MDIKMRKMRRQARLVGLDVRGPYFGDVYCLVERWSGEVIADRLSSGQIEAEVTKHRGVPRLADRRRRREP